MRSYKNILPKGFLIGKLNFIMVGVFLVSSCGYFEAKKEQKLREESKNRTESCVKAISHVSFLPNQHFTLEKQRFVKENKGKVFGEDLYVKDVLKIHNSIYLYAEFQENALLLKLTNDKTTNRILNADKHKLFCFFTIEKDEVTFKTQYDLDDFEIEDNKLIDYSIYSDKKMDILFIGELISICE